MYSFDCLKEIQSACDTFFDTSSFKFTKLQVLEQRDLLNPRGTYLIITTPTVVNVIIIHYLRYSEMNHSVIFP